MRYFSYILLSLVLTTQIEAQDLYWEDQGKWQDSIKSHWADTNLFFPTFQFQYAKAFYFNDSIVKPDFYDPHIYDKKTKKLAKSIDTIVLLTQKDLNIIHELLNDTSSFQWAESGCYYPRHAILYFDSLDNVVGSFEICFECDQSIAIPATPRMRQGLLSKYGWWYLAKYFDSIGLTVKRESWRNEKFRQD